MYGVPIEIGDVETRVDNKGSGLLATTLTVEVLAFAASPLTITLIV